HQLNTPWLAFAWGTKRWASYANVCQRTTDGSAFPGDEGSNYRLNPGEAFAETYRILNEQAWGQGPFWLDVVDQSFVPDQAAIDAVRADVETPWQVPTVSYKHGRFSKNRVRVRSFLIATPLDGN